MFGASSTGFVTVCGLQRPEGRGRDLKPIYQAANLAGAEQKLADFKGKEEQKYPLVVESWQRNWLRLTRFFEYPAVV
ncbi:hypothetical protein GCM10028810_01450 [Spirosoma litoris]